jgi:NAD(P)-dependent dehydrogenase (short-subunit alcohol dehydrogenase family)
MEFEDHTVIVTGAAGNLGRAVAKAFGREGANLVLADLDRGTLAQRSGDDDERQLLVAADLRDRDAANAVADAAMQRFRRIDVLCNIAGGFRMGAAVHETSGDTWDFLLDLNARTVLNMAAAVVPRMIAGGGGKVVNVGAYAAQKGVAGMGAYCAAKAAVIRLTEAMAAELREKNVNVNCVLPTIIDTPENRRAMPGADASRWVAPDDLANVVLFLASQRAKAIHGAAVPVSGLS